MIPVYNPSLSALEEQSVLDCIKSSWISSKGEYISEFETEFSNFNNVSYSNTVCNGTCALHLALLALGINSNDEVIVPSLTYIASVNAIKYVNAKPVFADCVLDTWQIDPVEIERKITSKTKAIIVVHLYGHPADMDSVMKIAHKHNLYVIEDCAEAIGSSINNQLVGTFGDFACFSFFGNKTITTGEGGMLSTNNYDLHKIASKLKGQGLAEGREYWHDVIGYNYRMTNICASIGLAQLKRIDSILDKKWKIAQFYKDHLHGLPLILHNQQPNFYHSYWMVSILVEDSEIRDSLRDYLKINNIETRPVFFPIHQMPMYFEKNLSLPNSEYISSRGINLPSWPDLTIDQLYTIVNTIRDFYKLH